MSRPAANLNDDAPTSIRAAGEPRGRPTLVLGLLGSLLCYLAHPPMGWSLLAWVGPTPWLVLARLPRLPGRRPYLTLWAAGVTYWLAAVQWLRLPHPANHFGLLLLACYLGAYLPVFVGLTRVGVHRWRLPLWLVAPMVWTGLEWLRARLLTGFLMASLAHTQVRFPLVIQIADVFGEYGVTFVIVLVAAAIAEALPLKWFAAMAAPSSVGGSSGASPRLNLASSDPRLEAGAERRWSKLVPAAVTLTAAFGYGQWQLWNDLANTTPRRVGPTIALIQSDMLADWKGTPERDTGVMSQMYELSQRAVANSKRRVDLIVWPETMYRDPLLGLDEKQPPTAEFDPERVDATRRNLAAMADEFDAAMLVGLDRYNAIAADATEETPYGYRIDSYNSSALVDRTGRLIGTYDKIHLLPFGEFIPFVKWLPFLRGYSPITGAAISGELPKPLTLEGVNYAVNICYETVLPQLIRREFVHLIREHQSTPDVMVNLTNDAWYWGSSELDMHLASGVFRAVEMRTPLVVAANRGLSAHVDHLGRIMGMTERNKPATLVAHVTLPNRTGPYPTLFVRFGDWFALVCLVCSTVLAAVGWRERRRRPLRE